MARTKSKLTEILYIRITKIAKDWATKRVETVQPSFSAYVDDLIRKDKRGNRKFAKRFEANPDM